MKWLQTVAQFSLESHGYSVSRDRIEQEKTASFLAAFVGTWSAIGKV